MVHLCTGQPQSAVLAPQLVACRRSHLCAQRRWTRCNGASESDIGLKSGPVTVTATFPPASCRKSERFQQSDCGLVWEQAAATAVLSTALLLPSAGIWPAAAAVSPPDATTARWRPTLRHKLPDSILRPFSTFLSTLLTEPHLACQSACDQSIVHTLLCFSTLTKPRTSFFLDF